MTWIRRLPLSLAILSVLAGAAAAQFNRDHMRPHGESNTRGVSIDDAIKQLSSDDPEQRLAAVKMLGASKDGKAIAALIKACGDTDIRVQAKAVRMLGDARASDATTVLVERLFLHTTNAGMKQLILSSLGKIGDMRAAQPLIELLQRDHDPTTRGTAIFALGEIGAPESVDTLDHIARTEEDQTLRRLANEAKQKIQGHHPAMDTQAEDPLEGFPGLKGPSHPEPGADAQN